MVKIEGSSNIADVDWKEVKGGIGTLIVGFHSGDAYEYYDVPKGIYQKLMAATSKGKFFDLYIVKAGYKYTKKKPEASHMPPKAELNILKGMLSFMEQRGMVIREQDEQGNLRIVLVGEITKELFG